MDEGICMDENDKYKNVLYILCKHFILSDSVCECYEKWRGEDETAVNQLLCYPRGLNKK